MNLRSSVMFGLSLYVSLVALRTINIENTQ